MADTRPTKLSFFAMLYLCFLAVFKPVMLIEKERKDNETRAGFSGKAEREHNAYIVHRAFWGSLGLIVLCGLLGVILGLALALQFNQPAKWVTILMQILGANLLLWGTLFVRGWEIETYCGVTFSERVNSWIYRILYCVGTSILIIAIVWDYN